MVFGFADEKRHSAVVHAVLDRRPEQSVDALFLLTIRFSPVETDDQQPSIILFDTFKDIGLGADFLSPQYNFIL